jgi:PTS system nitrogen regulatory IIA component
MELSVRDAAKVFGVSEPTILRWVKAEGLPSFYINGHHRFNRVDLLEWSHVRKHPMSRELGGDGERKNPFESLARALDAGGVHSAVAGADVSSALAAAAQTLPLSAADKALAVEVLMEREKHGTTAVGDGIAFPHPRSPLVFPVASCVVSLCFLERPVDFGAPDGKPVHALFVLLAPTVRAHLALLSELAAALHEPRFKDAVARRAPAGEILGALAGEP